MEERWKNLASDCESEAYGAALGLAVAEIGEGRVRLRLPYHDKNSNPGQALHGGVAASILGRPRLTQDQPGACCRASHQTSAQAQPSKEGG